MYIESAIPPQSQTTELMQPGDSAFDRPTCLSQTSTRLATARDVGLDAQPTQDGAKIVRVVRFVGNEPIRPPSWATTPSPNGMVRDDRRQRRPHIMRVGRAGCHRQGDANGIGQHMMLTARSASIRRVGAAFSPPSGALTVPESSSVGPYRGGRQRSGCRIAKDAIYWAYRDRRPHVSDHTRGQASFRSRDYSCEQPEFAHQVQRGLESLQESRV